MQFTALMECTKICEYKFNLPVIYRHCGNDYLGFDIGLICHGLGLGLDLELCGLVNITAFLPRTSVRRQ